MRLPDIGIAVFVMLIWGVNFAVAKFAVTHFPPIFMMTLRFALVALLLVPFVRRPLAPMRQVFALSLTLGCLHFALFFTGLKGIDASVAAVVIQLQVPFAVILASLFLGDRPGMVRVMGILIAFAGVAVIFAAAPVEGHYISMALMLSAALVWSLANLQIKAMDHVDGMSLNGWMALFAAPELLMVSLVLERGQWESLITADWLTYAAVAFTAVCSTIIGYGLWYRLIHKYPISLAIPFTLLAPIFGVASGIILLGEPMTLRLALGSLMTIAGVAIVVLWVPKAIAEPAE